MKINKTFLVILTVFIAISIVSCVADTEKQKKQIESIRDLGEAHMADGDYRSALKELLRAEAINADDPYLQNDLGLTYMAMQHNDEAIKHFEKAVQLKPTYAAAANNLGTAYIKNEEWDKAIDILQKVVNNLLYATPHFAYTNLGWAYYNKKDYAQAEKYFAKALEIEPTFITALKNMALTYIAQGKTREGIEKLQKAITIFPNAADLYYELGKAYLKISDTENARRAFYSTSKIATNAKLRNLAEQELSKLQ